MDEVWAEFAAEAVDFPMLLRVIIKISVACLCGSIIGLNREHAGENAGWRTHILVTIASAAFVMSMKESGAAVAELTRVVQGIATGVGFLGAGVILRMPDSMRVKGLTTAASIWLTAAVGCGVGAGRIWMPLVATIFGWFTLFFLRHWEHHVVTTASDQDA
jgi:putative Mg2+ transporter-C (MgtC) family protein